MKNKITPIKKKDLDVAGQLFGFKFVQGCSNGCVELYIEDDEVYHYQFTFDKFWLKDLVYAASKARDY